MTLKSSRRESLSAGLMLPVAAAASNTGLLQAATDKAVAKPANSPVKLDHRTLGKTGLNITTVGFGCMIRSDPSVIQRAADPRHCSFTDLQFYSGIFLPRVSG